MASTPKYTKEECKSTDNIGSISEPTEEVLKAILHACSRRLNSWPTPPNWSPNAWRKEASAIGAMAAVQAQAEYHTGSGIVFGAFLYQKVMAQARTRYRQEWAYAMRFAVDLNQIDQESDDAAEPFAALHAAELQRAAHSFLVHDLRDCVESLPEFDQWLLKQLFWHDRTQAEIAQELGVTQPAVAKRLRATWGVLREWLKQKKKKKFLVRL